MPNTKEEIEAEMLAKPNEALRFATEMRRMIDDAAAQGKLTPKARIVVEHFRRECDRLAMLAKRKIQ